MPADPAEPAETAETAGPPTPLAPPAPRSSGPRLRPGRRWGAAGPAAAVVLAGAVTATALATGGGCGSRTGDAERTAPAGGMRHTAVEVSTGGCGRGRNSGKAGTV